MIHNGCNSSSITLIPKVDSSANVKDIKPISLIGLQYKIIFKLLANTLVVVVGDVVSVEQSAFIKGGQILDVLLMVNEIVDWMHIKMMFFKVDFEKTYDSLI